MFWEEKDCTASLLLCDRNLFLFIISFLSSFEYCFAPFLPRGPIKLPGFLFIVVLQAGVSTPTRAPGWQNWKKENQIIYKWTGRRASGSNGWPHWASSSLFSFQSIWCECAFTNIYISPPSSGVCWFTLIVHLTQKIPPRRDSKPTPRTRLKFPLEPFFGGRNPDGCTHSCLLHQLHQTAANVLFSTRKLKWEKNEFWSVCFAWWNENAPLFLDSRKKPLVTALQLYFKGGSSQPKSDARDLLIFPLKTKTAAQLMSFYKTEVFP